MQLKALRFLWSEVSRRLFCQREWRVSEVPWKEETERSDDRISDFIIWQKNKQNKKNMVMHRQFWSRGGKRTLWWHCGEFSAEHIICEGETGSAFSVQKTAASWPEPELIRQLLHCQQNNDTIHHFWLVCGEMRKQQMGLLISSEGRARTFGHV